MAKEFYTKISAYGGFSGEYLDVAESDFAAAAGAAYSPGELGDYRRADGTRKVQLLTDCPVVVETFQTSSGTLVLPAMDVSLTTNDAGDGRLFFIKNSGTGDVFIYDYLGASLATIAANTITMVLGNTANTWDFLTQAGTSLLAGPNIVISGTNPYTISAFEISTTIVSAGTISLVATDNSQQRFTGVTAGQLVDLPDATTLLLGRMFVVWNDSTQSVDVRNGTGASLIVVPAGFRAILTVADISTAAGVWTWMTMSEAIPSASLSIKSGVVSSGSFAGSPKTVALSFATAFASSDYGITITGVDRRSWSYSSKVAGGFTLEANANAALSSEVSWHAILLGETA